MRTRLLSIIAFTFFACQAQEHPKFNLGFEDHTTDNDLPDDWIKWGNYTLSVENDSYKGSKSAKITSDETGSTFGSIAYRIPANYSGESIQLKGFMKIKNVENGFAGLLMRIDGNGAALQFDNMQNQNVSGTKDWQEYSITLPYPEDAEHIYIGGILLGKGEVWFDDFELSIDHNDVQTLEEVENEIAKAQLDTEFDNGSLIDIPTLSSQSVRNLELLGRIWGFIKYHHPVMGQGAYNWDYELFRFLPDYLNLSDSDDNLRDQSLIEWIDSYGDIRICRDCEATAENSVQRPDLAWINGLSPELKNKLVHIYANRHQGTHYYVGQVAHVGNPEFKHEDKYANMSYPDAGFRLLALYRYWNMIYYYFPYRHLMDRDWNLILKEHIPKFLHASNELEYELAAIQLIGDIQDTHANLWGGADKIDEWKGNFYPPVHLRFIEDQLVVTDHYNLELKDKSGLELGDIITKINGQTIPELIQEKAKYYPASNYPTRLRDISADLLRSQMDEIQVTYRKERTDEESEITLQLYPRGDLDIYHWYRKTDEKCYKILDENIGYITLQSIKDEDIPIIKKEFIDTKGIIIDIRNYPSTFVPFQLGAYFMSSPTSFVKFSKGNINNPGEFTFTESLEIPPDDVTFKGKLIVIVNELSQSQAEYTAMAFKAGDNTTIIGSTTAGADGNVSTIFLPGGLRTMISGIGVNYPNGTETQRVGIIPDLEVKPTIKGIREGKDELLDAAIRIILEG